MGDSAKFVLQQHRVYVLRDFEVRGGDVFCRGYALSNPETLIAARFPNAELISSWQEVEDVTKLPWPLEMISFRAVRARGKRFRFSLNCIDFQREWESDWPELIST